MHLKSRTITLLFLMFTSTVFLFGAGGSESANDRDTESLEFNLFGGNRIHNWIGNNGHTVSHIPTGNSGLEWPAYSGKTAVFAAGPWFVGTVDDQIRSAATEFTSEFAPGNIPYDTQTQQPLGQSLPTSPEFQVYHIQEGDSPDPSHPNFNWEYADWPAGDGAPAHDGEHFEDENENGVWDTGEPFEDYNQDGNYNGPDGEIVTGEDPPMRLGTEMAWYVMNDWHPSYHSNLWGTPPMGLEVQVLVYTLSLGANYEDIQIHRTTLINKSGETIEDSYYASWMDADVGRANDDYVGCDPALDLGYFYNGDPIDQEYGSTPPVVGYKILQGPLVPAPGETVEYEGNTYSDVTTLGMTAFNAFVNSSIVLGDPETAEEAHNLMQGLDAEGDPWHEYFDLNEPVTTFMYPGNPLTGEGWTEYNTSVPGDRRSLMSSGPFTMLPWDDVNGNGLADFGEPGVQIIHTALVIASGTTNLDAINTVKLMSESLQSDYDEGFDANFTHPQIALNGSGYDQEVLLNWFEGSVEYETYNWAYYLYGGYAFEGYEIYQGYSENGPWENIMTYDITNDVGIIMEQYYNPDTGQLENRIAHYGNNSGLQHFMSITEDALNGGNDLVNGEEYHFAIGAYFHNPGMNPPSVETSMHVVTVVPNNDGSLTPGEQLTVVHSGVAQAMVTVETIDPSQLSGDEYQLEFAYDSLSEAGSWHLMRDPFGDDEEVLSGSETEGQFYVDGFLFSLDGILYEPPRTNTFWEQTVNLVPNHHETAQLLAVSPGGVDSLAWTDETMTSMVHMDTLCGHNYPYDYFELETQGVDTWFILHREVIHEVDIQGFASDFGGLNGDRLADIPGVGGGLPYGYPLQNDLEIRFTGNSANAVLWAPQGGFEANLITVPFELWDVEQNTQICVGIVDWNGTGGIQNPELEDWEYTLELDWVIEIYRDYETYSDSLLEFFGNPNTGWAWQFNDESIFSIGDALYLAFANPVVAGEDVYAWNTGTMGVEENTQPDAHELHSLQIYPNPFNPSTTMRFNLPESDDVTLTVYDLKGREIWQQHLYDQAPGYHNIHWQGMTTSGNQAPSGIYLVEFSTAGFRLVEKAILLR